MRLGRETIILSMRAFLALAQSVRDKGHRRFAALFSLRHRYRRERLSTEQEILLLAVQSTPWFRCPPRITEINLC
jgi:hypothetical protein